MRDIDDTLRNPFRNVSASRIKGQGGRIVAEYKGDPEDNVREMSAWFEDYIADRRRRGIPKEGLTLYGGIRSIATARDMIGAQAP